ncbi:MAG: amidohydrolase family protein [Faecalibacterium sp.]
MKIIDAHVHLVQCIAGTGAGGEMRDIGAGRGQYADGTVFQLIPPRLGESSVTPESVLGLMDEYNVEKAVLLQGNFMGFQNLYSYKAQRTWPDRFLAAAAYDPFCRNRDGIRRHLFEELGIRVVKFEVSTGSGLMANHATLPLDGEVMEQEYAYADEQGLIFVIDIGKMGSESSQIPALRRAIARHAGMKFVVCHLLAPNAAQQAELCAGLEALALPNVWFDTASLQHNLRPDEAPYPRTRQFLRRAADIVGSDRLLFGSDLPSTLCRHRYEDLVECVAGCEAFSAQEKQGILYENARQLFWG